MIKKSGIEPIAAALFSVALLGTAAGTATAANGGSPSGKAFQAIQGQFDDVRGKISAIEVSIADLQMQIDNLVSEATGLEARIAINEQFIATLQADNLEIKDQLIDLALEAEAQGIAIDTNTEQIQELLLNSLANAGKIQYLEGTISQIEQKIQEKQDQLDLQCQNGMALTAIHPDGSIECEEFLTQEDFGAISERIARETTFNLDSSETKYWCPTTMTHHSFDEILQLDGANTLLCWASAALSTSLLHWNPYNGSFTWGLMEKTTPQKYWDVMCSAGEVAVWGGGFVPDSRYASIKGVQPQTDEETGQSGFRVHAQRSAPPYPTFCGPIMDAALFGIPLPNLLVDPMYCASTPITASVVCLK